VAGFEEVVEEDGGAGAGEPGGGEIVVGVVEEWRMRLLDSGPGEGDCRRFMPPAVVSIVFGIADSDG